MFKKNKITKESELFQSIDLVPRNLKKYLENSWAYFFRENVFKKIDEEKFSVLYSKLENSRPNTPVNVLFGLEIIKELFDYRDEELFREFHLNMGVAYALGLNSLGEMSIGERTLYYFRSRVLEYETENKINLYEEEFKKFRDLLREEFQIKTDKQRSDSFLVGSNIKKMSRVELVVKMIQMILESMKQEQRNKYQEEIEKYLKDEPYRMIFKKNKEEIETLLKSGIKSLAEILETEGLDEELKNTGKRLLDEQSVKKDNGERELKNSKDIAGNSIQSLHDIEATYRKKGKKESRGYIENVTETSSKDNLFQIITDVSLDKNTADDGKHLGSRMEAIKEETEVRQMAVDGGYMRDELKNDNPEIEFVFTGIPGKKQDENKLNSTNFEIENNEIRSCPCGEKPVSQEYDKEKQRIIANFDKEKCGLCKMNDVCMAAMNGKKYSKVIITKKKIAIDELRAKLHNDKEYQKKCKLRPAIEGTVWQFSCYMRNGKVRFRTAMKIRQRMLLKAIGINLKRMHKALKVKNDYILFYIYAFLEKIWLFKAT